jgi:hypothetical protein
MVCSHVERPSAHHFLFLSSLHMYVRRLLGASRTVVMALTRCNEQMARRCIHPADDQLSASASFVDGAHGDDEAARTAWMIDEFCKAYASFNLGHSDLRLSCSKANHVLDRQWEPRVNRSVEAGPEGDIGQTCPPSMVARC